GSFGSYSKRFWAPDAKSLLRSTEFKAILSVFIRNFSFELVLGRQRNWIGISRSLLALK
ncbi:hypothetical protein AX14_014198, partial [Amanita brunnescens Koide BX004]